MTTDEVQSMKFLTGSYAAKNKLQDVETAQNLLVILEKAQVGLITFIPLLKIRFWRTVLFEIISQKAMGNSLQVIVPENVQVLKEMTASLDRRDLFDKILEYEAVRSGVALPLVAPPVHPYGPAQVPPVPVGLSK